MAWSDSSSLNDFFPFKSQMRQVPSSDAVIVLSASVGCQQAAYTVFVWPGVLELSSTYGFPLMNTQVLLPFLSNTTGFASAVEAMNWFPDGL